MFRRLIRIVPSHFAITLVACVWLNCCAVTQASCGNYLHTRYGAPRPLLVEQPSAAQQGSTHQGSMQQGLLLSDLLDSSHMPFRPHCSGPHCRQAPSQPFQIPRLPPTNDSSSQEAGCLPTAQPGSSAELQSALSHTGTAAALPGFPPAIEIPPEAAF